MSLCLLLNRGEHLLCDEYTYSHLVEAMIGPKGYKAVPVAMDEHGMIPQKLQEVGIALAWQSMSSEVVALPHDMICRSRSC